MSNKRQVERPTQQTPADLIASLMTTVRNKFYRPLADPDRWFKDQHFIKRNVVLWPAGWLNKKGVTLPPDRYKEILTALFIEIETHATGVIKYPPGFLMKSVQDHFRIQGDKYYEEGKSIRAKADNALLAIGRAQDAKRTADPVSSFAQAHKILTIAHKKKPVVDQRQGNLF